MSSKISGSKKTAIKKAARKKAVKKTISKKNTSSAKKKVKSSKTVRSIKKQKDQPVLSSEPIISNANVSKELLGVGLDMGTSYIVASRMTDNGPEVINNRNAFLFIRDDDTTKEMLDRMRIPQELVKERACVLGKDAFDFSNYFDRLTQRPMNIGVINPLEREAIRVLNMIVDKMLWKPRVPNEICSFSVPVAPVDSNIDILYHKNVIETMLRCFGFEPIALNEAYAVVLSELKDKKFTGIGVSCGGGMVNICVTYKSVVITEFSVARGGDWIDVMAANMLDMPANKATVIKESGMNIARPETREQEAIAVYYKQYIHYFLEQISKALKMPGQSPQFEEPIDIVFAGGSTLAGGFIDVVKKEMKSIDLGIPINEVRVADDAFTSVSRGCLFNSQQMNK